jgi:isoleucyl-tRNA synthetase
METKKLNMPKTNFTQRSNSSQKEPELLKLWEKTFMERNEKNKEGNFVLHDGPPYANGDVHMGHVLNKVLKDMVSKYQLMNGKKVDFRPGFDCHGLPTELGVQKKFGKNLSTKDLRQKCGDWANKFKDKQTETFKSLGVLADWDNSYKTMDKNYELNQLKVLYKLLNDGKVFLDERPVYYSPSSRTVLAESELEYKERNDKSAYFTFELEDGRLLLCWTTQPWTVLGNMAVCLNPEMEYSELMFNDNVYLTSSDSVHLFDETFSVLSKFKGKELNGLTYKNTLNNTKGLVVNDSFVKSGSGTGLVHLCPGHGEEDFDVCKKFGLSGKDLTDSNGNVNGLFCLTECTDQVLKDMKDCGMLFKQEEYSHSYPHDWRTGGPVYYKLTEQFFLNLKELKELALNKMNDVDWSEKRWENRLRNMLNLRDRWCLSRQRKWGFPLAVFLKDEKPYLHNELEDHLYKLFEEFGSDVWFNYSTEELLPDKFKNMNLKKCEYTIDVWFDSGVSWLSVVGGKSDLYLEGSDQHRGWFQSSLLTSLSMNGDVPYKKVLTHGFVLDENGRKMSKSLGNVVEPKEVQSKYNTDVLRLWCSVVNYSDDAQLGDSVLKNCADHYFKLRNTMKYLLGNMYGYDESYDFTPTDKDLKALERCDMMYKNTLKYYSEYNFRKAFEEIMSWVSEFSSSYLDNQTKSFLYEYDLDSDERLRCQYVLKYSLERFMKVLAPMTSFLAEDAYQHYEFKKFDSVFMESF